MILAKDFRDLVVSGIVKKHQRTLFAPHLVASYYVTYQHSVTYPRRELIMYWKIVRACTLVMNKHLIAKDCFLVVGQ